MSRETCPSCGEPSLVKGSLQSTGAIHFRPIETRFLTFLTADIAVHASMCASCGSIVMTGDVDKLGHVKSAPCPRWQEAVPSLSG